MKKLIRPILLGLLAILVVIQFFRPTKNQAQDTGPYDISTRYAVPDDVQAILKVACNDCHSNHTVYPWYAEIQPVAWWIADHVEEGKHHLDFSSFTQLPIAVQNHKFEEVIEVIKENEMPMQAYTLIHRDAALGDLQKKALMEWAQQMMDTLRATYPADSLVMKRRR
ncbi:MAG: heme-binding domain-containing protein [Bacteroidia bacterium]|nr:heme-binding domain-containing protein [Bacteroidia bacterium]